MSHAGRRDRRAATDPDGSPGLRALAAACALLGILAGIPAALLALGTALGVDLAIVGPGALAGADDGRLLILVLLALGWAAWAAMAVGVANEILSAVRRVPTPTLPGLGMVQQMAASLVGAVVLAMTSGPVASASAPPDCDLAAVVARASSAQADHSEVGIQPRSSGDEDPGRPVEVPVITRGVDPAPRTVVTQRHDTLWMLAEQLLGRGERFTEIVVLNRGVTQPDGRALGADGRLYPGWTLTLPADARVDAPRPPRHVVVRGDTLWDVAGSELGDPARYPEIVEANLGDLQPDGRRLSDPDLIRPGWVLELPDDHGPAVSGQDAPVPQGSPGPEGRDSDRSGIGASRSASRGESDGAEFLPATSTGVPEYSAADSGESIAVTSGGHGSTPSIDAEVAGAESAGIELAGTESAGTQAPCTEASVPVADDGPEPGIRVPSGGTVAALVLAGFAAELARRRRQFQRYRRPGERMPRPGVDVDDLEATSRAAAVDPRVDLLERSMRQLALESQGRGLRLPDIRIVRLSESSVVLEPMESVGDPVPPFTRLPEGRWGLDRSLMAQDPSDHPPAYPALVTLGTSGSDVILLNLESVGTLVVAGDRLRVEDVLRAFAAELAFSPSVATTARTFHLVERAIADVLDAGWVAQEPSAERAAMVLRRRLNQPGGDGPGAPPGALHGADPDRDDPVDIVLADGPLDVCPPAWSGAALITSVDSGPRGATLHVEADGNAILLPERVLLRPQALPRTGVDPFVSALQATDIPEGSSTPEATVAGPDSTVAVPSRVIDLRESPSDGAAPRRRDPRGSTAPRVLVLGEVRVLNAEGKAESSRIGRLSETAAFVLLNPGTRPSDLQSALWPGRRSSPQTCRQMISRTRTWLGRADEGDPYLMPLSVSDGRLRLREEVGSDWHDFQELAEIGLSDPDDVEHLARALALVRGRPFGSVASRELPWADLHINDMISLITDVAHELASRHLRAGRHSLARDAALRGLLTESESEVLSAIARGSR